MTSNLTENYDSILKEVSLKRNELKELYVKAWLASNVLDENLNMDWIINNTQIVETWSQPAGKVSWQLEFKKMNHLETLLTKSKELRERFSERPGNCITHNDILNYFEQNQKKFEQIIAVAVDSLKDIRSECTSGMNKNNDVVSMCNQALADMNALCKKAGE